MGDFEDVFGAGADADDIIDSYSRAYSNASPVEKARWFGKPDPQKLQAAIDQEELDDWSKKMNRQGFVEKASFKTYEELNQWMKQNIGTELVSRRTTSGFVVFAK